MFLLRAANASDLVQFVEKADRILILNENGQMMGCGSMQQLIQQVAIMCSIVLLIPVIETGH